ncbi:MAG: HEAT repeat domain-containing protein, partial [Armatimonadota bacterium]
MRRIVVYVALVAVAVALLFLLRHRKRQFVAAQVHLLQSSTSDEADAARKRLQRIGRSAVRPVCTLLEHDDEEVRARAALTLANIGHPAACGPLMQAAKRGDFPAADALESMKHPRAEEARSWVYCLLADEVFEEIRLRLPIGARLPTSPGVQWREPSRFRPVVRQTRYSYQGYGSRDQPDWGDILYALSYATRYYERAIDHYPLPEALIGRARVKALHGRYSGAAELYAQALKQSPHNEVAHRGQAEAERLARLLRAMEALLPDAYHVERILTHPTWRPGDTTYYLAIATFTATGVRFVAVAPKLVLFQERSGRLQKLSGVSTYTPPASGRAGLVYPTYVDLCVTEAARSASVVVIRPVQQPRDTPSSRRRILPELLLYHLESDTLVEAVRMRIRSVPWIGDIDDDGDAEIVTWDSTAADLLPIIQYQWPTIHALVEGEYQDRTDQFPAVFADLAAALRAQEEESGGPADPYSLF